MGSGPISHGSYREAQVISGVTLILWAINFGVGAVLLVLLAVRKSYRLFPAFSTYTVLNLALGILALLVYHRWGFSSKLSWRIAWAMQGAVICARALAWRILLLCAVLVLFCSLAAGHVSGLAILAGDRALELAIASVVVGILLFARYYCVQVRPVERALALGFCLFSCFNVLNNAILEHYFRRYVEFWNPLGMFVFLVASLVWTWALRKRQAGVPKQVLLPLGVYNTMMPEVNLQLRSLNDQLSEFFKPSGMW
jgi:hypothetical protein